MIYPRDITTEAEAAVLEHADRRRHRQALAPHGRHRSRRRHAARRRSPARTRRDRDRDADLESGTRRCLGSSRRRAGRGRSAPPTRPAGLVHRHWRDQGRSERTRRRPPGPASAGGSHRCLDRAGSGTDRCRRRPSSVTCGPAVRLRRSHCEAFAQSHGFAGQSAVQLPEAVSVKSGSSWARLARTAREIRGLRWPHLPVVNPRSHHATSPRTMRANVTHLTHGPTSCSHPTCVVRDAWTLRTTHMERAETLAPPPLEAADLDGTLLDLAGDAVPVSIQLLAVSRIAPIQGSCSRLLCLLAVGKVHALLPRLRHGRGSRRTTAGLSLLFWCRLWLGL